jgi:CO/xanthine dehydrogenase FAD-binding subunit
VPLGGGTHISQLHNCDVDLVDLQSLNLASIVVEKSEIVIGSMVKLQDLYDEKRFLPEFKQALAHEGGMNYRNQASLGGSLVTGTGRSAFLTLLLAMDAQMIWAPGEVKTALGEYLILRSNSSPGKVIMSVALPQLVTLSLEIVARSPLDIPILCVAICRWKSGRIRVALGGWGAYPILAVDGQGIDGVDLAAENAASESSDEWASAEYRRRAVGLLVHQMLQPAEGR